MALRFFKNFRDFVAQQSRNFRILLTRSVFALSFSGLTQNFTSVYTVELGADPLELGGLTSLGSVVNAFISAPIGWLADKYSLKKMFLIGMILEIAVPITYALSQDWWMVLVPTILFHITIGITWTLEIILKTNALRRESRVTGFGIISTASQIPAIITPALGGIIVAWAGGISVEGIRPLFVLQFLGFIPLIFWVYRNLEEPGGRANPGKKGEFLRDFKMIFKGRRDLKKWMLLDGIGSFSFGLTMPYIMVYAAQIKGADSIVIGLMGSALTFFSMVSAIPVGMLADKIGRKKTILLFRGFYYASILMLLYAPRPEFLILAFGLRGFLWSSFNAWMVYTMEMVEQDQRGRWRGVTNTFRALARIPAPIIGGFLWETIDPAVPFLLTILIDAFVRMPILATLPETVTDKPVIEAVEMPAPFG